jgi:predicted DNA-binding transcriptional regulator AlpA
MMTRKLAADYCCLSEAQFEREIIDGRLPIPVRLGGRDSWHRATMDQYLERIANPESDWRASSPIYANDPKYHQKRQSLPGLSSPEEVETSRRRARSMTASKKRPD